MVHHFQHEIRWQWNLSKANLESIFLLPNQITIQDTRIKLSATKKPELSAVNKNKKVEDLKAKFELREAGTWVVLDAAFGVM